MASEDGGVEDFALVSAWKDGHIYDEYRKTYSASLADPDVSMQAALRQHYPDLSLTVTFPSNVPLLRFAAAGHATSELDSKDEVIQRYRRYVTGNLNQGIPDQLREVRSFAKYIYCHNEDYFIVYIMTMGYSHFQYILKEPGEGETLNSTNFATDRLIYAVGQWANDSKYIYVFDEYWTTSTAMYQEIMKASWKDVILDEDMKNTLTDLVHKFFDSKEVYHDLGVPWKRGIIFHGPAGNGKTISIKAMMHDIYQRSGFSIPSLYVKSAPRTYDIGRVFSLARQLSPCLLILEDIDTIVTKNTRSYFYNEVDGLQNNDGIFMVASTNHLDRLDPGLASRPSRFDRKYLFPSPDLHERTLYCQYWKHKLRDRPSVEFPAELCPAIARITQDFTFAYMKEAFVASLIVIAGRRSHDKVDAETTKGNLDRYELWRVIKQQVQLLRHEMDTNDAAERSPLSIDRQRDRPWMLDENTDSLTVSQVHAAAPCPDYRPPMQDTPLPFRSLETGLEPLASVFTNNLTIQPAAPLARHLQ